VPTVASVLDDPAWHSLVGAHARHARGSGAARAYDPEVSVFAALEPGAPGAWADLAPLARQGHVTVVGVEEPAVPEGWRVVFQGRGGQLVLDGDPAPAGARAAGVAVVELGPADAPRMAALIDAARPGPWRARTVELGGYVGVVEGDRLLAMAGRRLRPDGHVELSAVCTHPEAWGRGFGEAVTRAVARAALAEGLVPFLHVAAGNDRARALYERMGFRHRRDVVFTRLEPA
jgi:GNAT superfamily N-acetyltransferase